MLDFAVNLLQIGDDGLVLSFEAFDYHVREVFAALCEETYGLFI